ncbi:MAG TPA: PhnD/SsuA/transferrin family substrate-binding protein [Rhodocyclaceae bacterium]|nr:PhnD/SsuA/transferrin family substrate-binding protein [Rhodocyclaceae bacterium]
MTLNFTVSPSFPNERISDWYIFNTWLQRALSAQVHLELYDGFGAQRQAIADGKVDLIYANPFDASLLVREKGFRAVAGPDDRADEMVVFTTDASSARQIADLKPGTRLACTDDPAVNTVGRILLEPAGLGPDNTVTVQKETYVQVARDVLQGHVDVGFMPVEAFEGLSRVVRRDLRPLVTSQLHVLFHVFLVGPALAARSDEIAELLTGLNDSDKGRQMLAALGSTHWRRVSQEDAEFMIDIISTLAQ